MIQWYKNYEPILIFLVTTDLILFFSVW
jgi:hypothetical protein